MSTAGSKSDTPTTLARIAKPLRNYIHGEFVTANGPEYKVPNPSSGDVLTTFSMSTAEDVNAAIESAQKAQPAWAAMPPKQRARLLLDAANLLRERNDEYAELEAVDTGRPLQETNCVDIVCAYECLEYMASLCATTASVGQHILLEGAAPGSSYGYTRREPLGVTAGIGAWNYPIQSAIWKAGPSLAAGNTMVFKPAENTPLTALVLAEVLVEAGVPPGVFNVVLGDGPTTGAPLAQHPALSKISFTGSVPTGIAVYEAAARNLMPATLELGGKSPVVIMDDAKLDNAVAAVMVANWYSNGEICSNGTRVFVQRGLYERFLARLMECTERLKLGNPLDLSTEVGPLVSQAHFKRVQEYIKVGIQEGATVANGSAKGCRKACHNR